MEDEWPQPSLVIINNTMKVLHFTLRFTSLDFTSPHERPQRGLAPDCRLGPRIL
ncbi:hypothetical protein KGM_202473 [Danaus plexippus plexippus]|uniref:Uncharacterized protein n=1 Tax=Danaus plexippus plexippus TaxID=278856 RepID=A0A212EXT7_DANPL|nr:hypothetical protein KGM_202473 [Danaus plexippus plexippus]